MSTKLPIEDATAEESRLPKLLHDLDVNALNFCAFAVCYAHEREMLIATPGVEDGHVNVTSLPAEKRIATLGSPNGASTGMVMALGLINRPDQLLILAGYENGQACVWKQIGQKSQVVYMQKTHAQPILSIGIAHSQGMWFTSGADAIVARHPFQAGKAAEAKMIQTKHAGQQGLAVRNDQKIFATAGWDGRMRVYSVKGMKELAVLKWHGEGCYAVAFADVDDANAVQGRSLTVAELRVEKARTTHWLAAGSKDGKVSLWEIY
jgi:WD40 repeat protein